MRDWKVSEFGKNLFLQPLYLICSLLSGLYEQGISISEILNHDSISFGRYAAEPLAWEKWSVFSHNRCQEELEKFKAPGLVAQKKAYFEEYYRRIRALKAAEAEVQKQETTHHPEPYQDDLTATTSAEDSVNDAGSKEEEQTSVVTQIQFSDTETTFPNLSGDSIENKSEVAEQQRSYSSSSNGEASVGYKADVSYSALDLAHSPEVASPEPVPQSDSSSEAAQQNGLVSDMGTVNLSSSKREDQAPVLKPKVNIRFLIYISFPFPFPWKEILVSFCRASLIILTSSPNHMPPQ